MTTISEIIRNAVDDTLEKLRLGYFVATVGSAAGRVQVTSRRFLGVYSASRVAPQGIDIAPKVGTRVVIINENGLPAYGATVGTVFDETHNPAALQEWLRADTNQAPGEIELGAQRKSVLKCGENLAVSSGAIGAGPLDALVMVEPGQVTIRGLNIRIEGVNVTINGRHILPAGGDL